MHCYGESAFTVKNWLAEGKDPRTLANSYLIEFCNNLDFFGFTGGVPRPGGMLSQLDSQALLTFDNMTSPGAYSDMDMLHVCSGGQTATEYRSQMTLWSMLASPLILGNDVTSMDDTCKSIVLNHEIIAISQDQAYGATRAKLVYQWPDAHWPNATTSTLAAATDPNAISPTSSSSFSSSSSSSSFSSSSSAPLSPAPLEQMQLELQPCATAATAAAAATSTTKADARQRFYLNVSDDTIRTVAFPQLCLTYGGYREANFYLGACESWSVAGIGGQKWTVKPAAVATSSIPPPPGSALTTGASALSQSQPRLQPQSRSQLQSLSTLHVVDNEEKCMDVYGCEPGFRGGAHEKPAVKTLRVVNFSF